MKRKILVALLASSLIGCNQGTITNSEKENINNNTNKTNQNMDNKSFTATIVVDKTPDVAFN
ncbi:MAG TPA: hypothetical protein VF691_00015, partial [Cytophagaceae bacterium]